MKNWLFAALILAAGIFLPVERISLSEIKPAELLSVYSEGSRIVVETDTGDAGKANTLQEAVDNLQKTADGEVLLKTVDYVVVQIGCEKAAEYLSDYVRPGTRLCYTFLPPDAEQVTEYLRIHQPQVTLQDYLYGNKALPILLTGERMELVETQ